MVKTRALPVFSRLTAIFLGGIVLVAVQHGVDGGLAHRHGHVEALVLVEAGLGRPVLSAAASTSPTLSMVELSEKLSRPSLGALTGFVIRLFRNGMAEIRLSAPQPTLLAVSWLEQIVSSWRPRLGWLAVPGRQPRGKFAAFVAAAGARHRVTNRMLHATLRAKE